MTKISKNDQKIKLLWFCPRVADSSAAQTLSKDSSYSNNSRPFHFNRIRAGFSCIFYKKKNILPRRKLLGAIETLEKRAWCCLLFSTFLFLFYEAQLSGGLPRITGQN